MTENDIIFERNNLERLCKGLSLEKYKEVLELVPKFKALSGGINIGIDSIALLVFLYRNNLIVDFNKTKGEK